MTDVDAARFLQAPLITRAVLLLQRAFRDPMEPVSLKCRLGHRQSGTGWPLRRGGRRARGQSIRGPEGAAVCIRGVADP